MSLKRHTAREVAPEPSLPAAELGPLRSLLMLQVIRKVMADASVIVARRQFQVCQQTLDDTQRSLHESIDHSKRVRRQAIEQIKSAPSELRTLTKWQHQTHSLLADIGTQEVKVKEAQADLVQSDKTFQSSLLRRRQIEVKQFKYSELIKLLSDDC